MALTARIDITLDATLSDTLDLSRPKDRLVRNIIRQLTSGTGANQADLIFHDSKTLAGPQSASLQFTGSTMADVFGNGGTFARMNTLVAYAHPTNTEILHVSTGASDVVPIMLVGAVNVVAIHPGGMMIWNAGPSATDYLADADNEFITFNNFATGPSIDYDVIVLGSSV